MFQRDYLMRMVEQMTSALAQVAGMRQRKENLEAQMLIDELLDRRFRMKYNLLTTLSDKDIVDLLTTNSYTDYASLQAIALLLKEKGDIYADTGDEQQAYENHLKSLHLFIHAKLGDSDSLAADPGQEAEALNARLQVYELPAETKQLLLAWHEQEGRFGQAENLLYELLEDGNIAANEAERFYLALLHRPDSELVQGGLPREEVQSGLDQLVTKINFN
ncbi:hypothetical protein EBB07_02955 [Paenibacillaceae bacterium]|nr:hypothetical protein EBB07_02955 [Paenibacillaceae bacterium]